MSPYIGVSPAATVKDFPNSRVINCWASGGCISASFAAGAGPGIVGAAGCCAKAKPAKQKTRRRTGDRMCVLYRLRRRVQVTNGSLLDFLVVAARPHFFEGIVKALHLLRVGGEVGVVVLAFQAAGRPVSAAVAQQPAVDQIGFQVH